MNKPDPDHLVSQLITISLSFPPSVLSVETRVPPEPTLSTVIKPTKTISGNKHGPPPDHNSDGYDSDNEDSPSVITSAHPSSKKRHKIIDESKREERNAREKERSFRITRQINELRDLFSPVAITGALKECYLE